MKQILNLWKKYGYVLLLAFIIAGAFDLRIGAAAIVCMVSPIIISIFKGRFWCGNFCPRGSFYDNIVSKFSSKKPVPKLFRSTYFRIAVVIFMFTMFTLGVVKNWGNLYGIGMVFYRLVVVTTIVGIGLSFFYNHRTWCNFCPMGSIASFIASFKNRKNRSALLQVGSSCVSCKICEKKCPMNIAPYEYKGGALEHHDCIQCAACVFACPKKAINNELQL